MTKTFTLLLAAGAMLCGSATAQAAPGRFGPHAKKAPMVSIDRKSAIDAALRAASQSGVKHLPLKVTVSVPDEEKGGWEVSELREYTYNESGLVATETTTFLTETGALSQKVTYTYDANGSVKSKLEEIKENNDAEWRKSNLEQYSYDEILTDFVTGMTTLRWNGNDWYYLYAKRNLVVRNGEGIITAVTNQDAHTQDKYRDLVRMVNTVSTDGKSVTGIYLSDYTADWYSDTASRSSDDDDDDWPVLLDLRDIVWNRTDGQVIVLEEENLYEGYNRIASAKAYIDGELAATVSGTYPNDFEGTFRMDFLDGTWGIRTKEYTEAGNGSYMTTYDSSYWDEAYYDVNGDGVTDENDMVMTTEVETIEYTFDERGNLIKEESIYNYNDIQAYDSGYIYEYVYDTDGIVTQMTVFHFEVGYEPSAEERYDFSDFITVSALEDVVAQPAPVITTEGRTLGVNAEGTSSCTVIALDGKTVASAAGEGSYTVALDNLASGIYVARVTSGNDTVTKKIVIR